MEGTDPPLDQNQNGEIEKVWLHQKALFKTSVCVFGCRTVGKSGITKRFLFGKFSTKYKPTYEDRYEHTVYLDCQPTKLLIIDICTTEAYLKVREIYIRLHDGFILVYAINDRSSFEGIKKYYRDIVRVKESRDVPLVLCGSKCDLEDARVVSKREGEELAESMGAAFYETSALADINIHEAFHAITRAPWRKKTGRQMRRPRSTRESAARLFESKAICAIA